MTERFDVTCCKNTQAADECLLHYFIPLYAQDLRNPLARCEAPAEGRRPEGDGVNIDRCLIPYHAKWKRIQSRIEFIYIYIYLFIYIHQRPSFLRRTARNELHKGVK